MIGAVQPRTQFYNDPFHNVFVMPDGCCRPWDLHPLSLVGDGNCAVAMIHDCYTHCTNGRTCVEDGNNNIVRCYIYTLTEQGVVAELDISFHRVGRCFRRIYIRERMEGGVRQPQHGSGLR